MGSGSRYRYAANASALDERNTVESIAVLLPVAPTGTARSFLEHVAADSFEVELICPHRETCRHERLTDPSADNGQGRCASSSLHNADRIRT